MNEAEALKKKKLAELQQRYQQQAEEEHYLQQQIGQLEAIARSVLTKEALQRYGNLKSAHPEKAIQALIIISSCVQKQRIQQIDDNQFKALLQQLSPEKKNIKVNFR